MVEYFSSLIQTGLFKSIQIVLILLFAIVITEMIFCIVKAMKFRVETLSNFRERFLTYYRVYVERNTVSWEESKDNWFLWLSVYVGNISTAYQPLYPYQSQSELDSDVVAITDNLRIIRVNTVCAINNIGRYAVLVISTPFYLIFSACSLYEQFCRFLLDPVVYSIFWVSAKIKIFLIYHFQGKRIIVDSVKTNTTCTIDVIYRKPIIRILLRNPQDCPDSSQKDNINHFTTTLREFLPPQNHIMFKTEVVYSADESALQEDLPLTNSYLRATYAKLTHIKS